LANGYGDVSPSYTDAFVLGRGTPIGDQVEINTNRWMHLASVNNAGVLTFYTNVMGGHGQVGGVNECSPAARPMDHCHECQSVSRNAGNGRAAHVLPPDAVAIYRVGYSIRETGGRCFEHGSARGRTPFQNGALCGRSSGASRPAHQTRPQPFERAQASSG
jgi:hypothetical protein